MYLLEIFNLYLSIDNINSENDKFKFLYSIFIIRNLFS